MLYGVVKEEHLHDTVDAVCGCLGHGANGTAKELLLETMAAETGLGTVPDRTLGAGMGVAQFDEMPFYDVKDRTQKWFARIEEELGVDCDLVEWEDLRYSPLLSVIFMRLKYKLIEDEIPETVEGRAEYWKYWYNSEEGGGTVEHYLEASTLVNY